MATSIAIAIGALEQPIAAIETATVDHALGVYNGVPLGQKSVGGYSASMPTPREPGALAPSGEISDPHAQYPAPAAATPPEAPRLCSCGCKRPAPIARKTDRRSGAVGGQPLRFVKGHAARLRSKLSFADITEDWFLDHVDTTSGHWFADATEATVKGHRVHMARIGVLLWQHQAVTPEALANLRLARRCRRGCVRPDHQVVLLSRPKPERMFRTVAIEAARARLAAFRATGAT